MAIEPTIVKKLPSGDRKMAFNKQRISVYYIFVIFIPLLIVFSVFFSIFCRIQQPISTKSSSISSILNHKISSDYINVYVVDLPRSLNYGLLDMYWSLNDSSRLGSEDDDEIRVSISSKKLSFPPYPESPLIKQYSAEYWILGDLMTPERFRTGSFAKRVYDEGKADVFLVPFFATLSAEIQLTIGKSVFRKKEGNHDYERQKEVVDFVRRTDAWNRSSGRDHVFVLTDPVAMWHVRADIAQAIFLVVDFGGWYRIDSKMSNASTSTTINHAQVSLIKDVIVPYTHILPRLNISENVKRNTLLYFKGAKNRHRGGLVRQKLWSVLAEEDGVIMEEGFPNATGRREAIKGMRGSEFCLHPAGDTPTSCRLFDALQSLCIPVVVSDNIELPFEDLLDYTKFSVFVSVTDALTPRWLLRHLTSFSDSHKAQLRYNIAEVQHVFEFNNGYPGAIGPVLPHGAVNHIWRKVRQKLPLVKEAVARQRRRPDTASLPLLRCHCT